MQQVEGQDVGKMWYSTVVEMDGNCLFMNKITIWFFLVKTKFKPSENCTFTISN